MARKQAQAVSPAEPVTPGPVPVIPAAEIVAAVARYKNLADRAERLEAEAKAAIDGQIKAHGVREWMSHLGTVQGIPNKGRGTSAGFDSERARHYMTPEQWAECYIPAKPSEKPGLSVRYIAAPDVKAEAALRLVKS